MAEISTKPYLIRAIHEWCTDSGYRPYIAVVVDERTSVPREFVRNGEIVLNVSTAATNRLRITNDLIEFEARFGGVPRSVSIPIRNVSAIYAQETGHGMAFEVPKALAIAPAARPEADEGSESDPRNGRRSDRQQADERVPPGGNGSAERSGSASAPGRGPASGDRRPRLAAVPAGRDFGKAAAKDAAREARAADAPGQGVPDASGAGEAVGRSKAGGVGEAGGPREAPQDREAADPTNAQDAREDTGSPSGAAGSGTGLDAVPGSGGVSDQNGESKAAKAASRRRRKEVPAAPVAGDDPSRASDSAELASGAEGKLAADPSAERPDVEGAGGATPEGPTESAPGSRKTAGRTKRARRPEPETSGSGTGESEATDSGAERSQAAEPGTSEAGARTPGRKGRGSSASGQGVQAGQGGQAGEAGQAGSGVEPGASDEAKRAESSQPPPEDEPTPPPRTGRPRLTRVK